MDKKKRLDGSAMTHPKATMKSKKREYVTGREMDDGVHFVFGPFTMQEAVKNIDHHMPKNGRQIYRLVPVHPAKKRGKGK